jgi:hypothetical protein
MNRSTVGRAGRQGAEEDLPTSVDLIDASPPVPLEEALQ